MPVKFHTIIFSRRSEFPVKAASKDLGECVCNKVTGVAAFGGSLPCTGMGYGDKRKRFRKAFPIVPPAQAAQVLNMFRKESARISNGGRRPKRSVSVSLPSCRRYPCHDGFAGFEGLNQGFLTPFGVFLNPSARQFERRCIRCSNRGAAALDMCPSRNRQNPQNQQGRSEKWTGRLQTPSNRGWLPQSSWLP